MTNASLTDAKRWQLQLNGRRIPRSSWIAVQQADALVGQANSLWRQAQEEAISIREQAYREGYATGQADATAKMASFLLEAQQTSREYLDTSEQRLIDLAKVIIGRIIPNLPYETVISDLVTAALRASRAERYVHIRVHPTAVEAVKSRLEQWRFTYFAVDSLEVGGDDSLGLYGCVVESEMGTVHAGLENQLQVLTEAARRAAGAVDGG